MASDMCMYMVSCESECACNVRLLALRVEAVGVVWVGEGCGVEMESERGHCDVLWGGDVG